MLLCNRLNTQTANYVLSSMARKISLFMYIAKFYSLVILIAGIMDITKHTYAVSLC
jgi:hypothetical protein